MTPAELRAQIDTIVILMMENRSFDHMLGHLRLPGHGGRQDILGLTNLLNPDYVNARKNTQAVRPFVPDDDAPLTTDLPHERDFIAEQLAHSDAAGKYLMNGFVTAYERYVNTSGVADASPMRILTQQHLPVTSFLADNYLVCNRWHAPLPASTQPNRLMALGGDTLRDTTHAGLIAKQTLMLDWLTALGYRWRVYSAGLSFLFLMPHMWDDLLVDDKFRNVSRLAHDFATDANFPQVILVEPDYDDSPIHLSGHANDNHPPLPVSFGEIFIKTVYDSLTAGSPARWARTLMILTYDEHGGFFDHVPPPRIPYAPPPGANYTKGFDSLGVRVPSILISPYTSARSTTNALLDHTSILQLLGERFAPDGTYSAGVSARRASGIASVTEALAAAARPDVPKIPDVSLSVTTKLTDVKQVETQSQEGFATALEGFAQKHGPKAGQVYPQIPHWLATRPK
jgi:phospholipase C